MRWLRSFKHLDRSVEVWRCLRRCNKPVSLLAAYLRVGRGTYPYHLELAGGVHVELQNFHDLVTAWVVFLRGEYRLRPGTTTLLDIGANIGCFSLKAAGDDPTVRVVAVEPFPSTFARLAANIAANGFQSRVSCWPVGVADGPGTRRMEDAGPSQSRGVLPAGEAGAAATVDVTVVSLEELLAKACAELRTEVIDFVKLDIEGGEHAALLATPSTALRRVRRLGMEYHPNRPKGPIFDHLISAGFRLESDREVGPNSGVAHFHRG